MTTTIERLATDAVVLDMDEATYHDDPIDGGSLSSSGAKQLLRSPAHYRHSLTHKWHKDAFDVGSAVHTQVLGTGWPVDVLDFDDWRTKAAKDARDASRAAGRVPVLERDYLPVLAMSSAVLLHPVAGKLFEREGNAEVSAFAPDTASGVWMRARIDWLTTHLDELLPVDLKTAQSAEPQRFARSAADFGYDLQAEWYKAVLATAFGTEVDSFRFVVVEKEPPHLVSVVELDDEFAAIGRARMRRAIDLYKRCRDADEWPGYDPITHLVAAPRWLAFEEGMVI